MVDSAVHAQALQSRRGSVIWQVDGNANDTNVKKLFSAINGVWPLWAHFTALDDSMYFVATALSAESALSPSAADRFIANSLAVLQDFYTVYGISTDLKTLEQELTEYFDARVPHLLH
jgi:hypothetical protein